MTRSGTSLIERLLFVFCVDLCSTLSSFTYYMHELVGGAKQAVL